MRFVNTKIHGIFDYSISVILVAIPWIFHLDKKQPETWIPICMGLAQIYFIFFSQYEVGVIRTIKMKVHLTLDIIAGSFLAVSPWTFGFHERVFLPHLVIGILIILMSLVTVQKSSAVNPEALDSSKA